MSKLYLGTDPRALADMLAVNLQERAKHADFFAPTMVVVPNRYMRKWLRLWLARRLDVAINLDFRFLDDALWHLLRKVDPSATPVSPEPIDDNIYRLMVLSVLLEEDDPSLMPLRRYLQLQGTSITRLTCRRAWHLADRLGSLLQIYEQHRQDGLIDRWLRHEQGLDSGGGFYKMMDLAQRSLFRHITKERDGRRALLNRLSGSTFKTLPQYALELMTRSGGPPRRAKDAKGLHQVHVFGFTQVSDMYTKAIGWLGQFFDVRYYHLNLASSRLPESPSAETIQTFVQTLRNTNDEHAADPGRELLRLWGLAGIESLWLMKNLLAFPESSAEMIHEHDPRQAKGKDAPSVLHRLQDHLLGKPAAKTRLPQDTSLQIVGCAGVAREVETVHNSILFNLHNDPSLRQTDVAILVTDMAKYRAPLQAVFERLPQRLQYNMVDFNAAGISMFGQALLGMLDLALESFSRVRVFEVILNPCFLARLGVERAQAMTWLQWAHSLGIYQGWDADEKEQQGYSHSPLYAWRLGLQRLRLGRYMEVVPEDAQEPAPRFGHVIPFADIASTDRDQLDAFCRAVEGLLPALARLRVPQAGGQRWANLLQRLAQEFLDVPADRPEESQVRDEVLAALERLAAWDFLQGPARRPGLPLALVREYLQSQLEFLQGNRGEYLIGGVTISALQPMRPVPFQIIYILGLGENLFPGSNALSSFDLRAAKRIPGDIHPAEERQYDFLATILAAQKKLYLLYNNHDLQKDQPFLPAAPLQQMQRYLNSQILKGEFQTVTMSLHDDGSFMDPKNQPPYQDVQVQYGDAERCVALYEAQRASRLTLNPAQQVEWAAKRQEFQVDFSIPPAACGLALAGRHADAKPQTAEPPAAVTLVELRRFLRFPAQESLRRHLHVIEDEEQTLEDDEPLITPKEAGYDLVRQTLRHLVVAAAQGGVEKALANWKDGFAQTYRDSRLRSRAPEDGFGDADQASIQSELQERIHGQGQIEAFLRQHADMTFCGPVLLGESMMPLGARLRFPALALRPGHELPADAMQEIRIAGWTDFAWHAPGRFDVLSITNYEKIDGRKLHAALIEPALLHMAMLANTARNADGIASNDWLAQREFSLHVAHGSGVQTWTYPAGSVTPVEAMHYFVELTRDFLDPAQFDLLPFDALFKNQELERAFDSTFASQIAPDDFRRVLEESIADARENPFYSQVKIPLLVEMIHAQVPADALAKVQRRLRLLDRAPGRIRRQPAVGKRPRTAKK